MGAAFLSLLTHHMCDVRRPPTAAARKKPQNRNPNEIGFREHTHASRLASLWRRPINGKFDENTHQIESQQDYMEIEMYGRNRSRINLITHCFYFAFLARNDFIVRIVNRVASVTSTGLYVCAAVNRTVNTIITRIRSPLRIRGKKAIPHVG